MNFPISKLVTYIVISHEHGEVCDVLPLDRLLRTVFKASIIQHLHISHQAQKTSDRRSISPSHQDLTSMPLVD
jgi:hypothetical protein